MLERVLPHLHVPFLLRLAGSCSLGQIPGGQCCRKPVGLHACSAKDGMLPAHRGQQHRASLDLGSWAVVLPTLTSGFSVEAGGPDHTTAVEINNQFVW